MTFKYRKMLRNYDFKDQDFWTPNKKECTKESTFFSHKLNSLEVL